MKAAEDGDVESRMAQVGNNEDVGMPFGMVTQYLWTI